MPIHVATANGHVEVVKFFANIPGELKKSTTADGSTPIFEAVLFKKLDILKVLLEKEPNGNVQLADCGNSLIHYAINDYEIFKFLMTFPEINPNLVNNAQETPLQLLCDRNHTKGYQIPDEDVIKMVKILAPLADPKHAQNSKDSPLNLAAKFGSTEILKILLQYFDANVHHLGGFLPIDKAMFHQRIEAIKILAPFTKELRVH